MSQPASRPVSLPAQVTNAIMQLVHRKSTHLSWHSKPLVQWNAKSFNHWRQCAQCRTQMHWRWIGSPPHFHQVMQSTKSYSPLQFSLLQQPASSWHPHFHVCVWHWRHFGKGGPACCPLAALPPRDPPIIWLLKCEVRWRWRWDGMGWGCCWSSSFFLFVMWVNSGPLERHVVGGILVTRCSYSTSSSLVLVHKIEEGAMWPNAPCL